MKRFAVAALALALVLGGCSNSNMGTKEMVGTGAGAIGGAVLGSMFGSGTGRLVGVAAGTMIGAFLGNEVGKSLDNADRAAASQAEQRAYNAPIGQRIDWSNPESGNRGSITPMREGRRNDGAYCREFQQSIVVGGETKQGYGTACQQPDGSWKIVS